jgi:predicted nucleic acid-binding protein
MTTTTPTKNAAVRPALAMKPIILDSTVVLAIHDPDNPHHHAAHATINQLIVHSPLAVPASVVSEVLVGAIRGGPHAYRTLTAFLLDVIDHIQPVDWAIATIAARYRAGYPGLPLHAALVLAAGKTLNASQILTTETSWQDVDPTRVRLIPQPTAETGETAEEGR